MLCCIFGTVGRQPPPATYAPLWVGEHNSGGHFLLHFGHSGNRNRRQPHDYGALRHRSMEGAQCRLASHANWETDFLHHYWC